MGKIFRIWYKLCPLNLMLALVPGKVIIFFLGPSGGYYWNSCNDLILEASISVLNISCTISLSVIF